MWSPLSYSFPTSIGLTTLCSFLLISSYKLILDLVSPLTTTISWRKRKYGRTGEKEGRKCCSYRIKLTFWKCHRFLFFPKQMINQKWNKGDLKFVILPLGKASKTHVVVGALACSTLGVFRATSSLWKLRAVLMFQQDWWAQGAAVRRVVAVTTHKF